ncbi:MAG: hypothetical protein K2I64_00950, partial [Muribaculaceae bacterium]|nr:hypothetical protein [Muribaculaceae bacterium]
DSTTPILPHPRETDQGAPKRAQIYSNRGTSSRRRDVPGHRVSSTVVCPALHRYPCHSAPGGRVIVVNSGYAWIRVIRAIRVRPITSATRRPEADPTQRMGIRVRSIPPRC